MYLAKAKFDEIRAKYGTTLFNMDDAVVAFQFVSGVLSAEAEAVKTGASYATNTIKRLETAAYEAFSVGSEVENEQFGERDIDG